MGGLDKSAIQFEYGLASLFLNFLLIPTYVSDPGCMVIPEFNANGTVLWLWTTKCKPVL